MFEKNINTVIKIEGMSCEHCAKKVSKNLLTIKGVKKVKVNLKEKEAIISSKEPLDLEQIKKLIDELGYQMIGEL